MILVPEFYSSNRQSMGRVNLGGEIVEDIR